MKEIEETTSLKNTNKIEEPTNSKNTNEIEEPTSSKNTNETEEITNLKNTNEIVEKPTSFWKIFWRTIITLIVIKAILVLIAFVRNSELLPQENSETKQVDNFIEEYSEIRSKKDKDYNLSDKVRNNLYKNEEKILSLSNSMKINIDRAIDLKIFNLFQPIYEKKIDDYLDYHYSVIGEYDQLKDMIIGDVEEEATKMLLGEDFAAKLQKSIIDIKYQYKLDIKDYISKIGSSATEGLTSDSFFINEVHKANNKFVGVQLGKVTLAGLAASIASSLGVKTVTTTVAKTTLKTGAKSGVKSLAKAAGAVGSMVVPKIVAPIVAKLTSGLVTKLASKFLIKTGWKTAVKTVVKTTASTIFGISIARLGGPIGAIIGAVAVWVFIDYVFVTVDEWWHRDELKEELVKGIQETENQIKQGIRQELYKSLSEISRQVISNYENIDTVSKQKGDFK